MKAIELAAVLDASADLQDAGDRSPGDSHWAANLATGLKAFGDKATVQSALKKAAKSADLEEPNSKRSPLAGQHVARLAKLMKVAKANSAAKDLDSLAGFLLKHHLSATSAAIIFKTAAAAPSTTAKKKVEPNIDKRKAREFADKLTAAVMDKPLFDQLISQMTDTSCAQAQAYAIADEFLGGKGRYKSKKDAINRIRTRQFQDVLHQTRGEVIDRVRV